MSASTRLIVREAMARIPHKFYRARDLERLTSLTETQIKRALNEMGDVESQRSSLNRNIVLYRLREMVAVVR